MNDIGNANWWGRSFSLFGWAVHVRVRRKGRRQTYRKWVRVEVYNYNYSAEAWENRRSITPEEPPEDEE